MRPLLPLLCLALLGCPKTQPVAKPAAPIGAGQQVTAATTASNAAQAAADSAELERLAKVAADSDAAKAALDDGRTDDAKGAISVQQGHLDGVQRDPAEAQQLKKAESKRAAGDTAGAESDLLAMRTAAQDDAVKIADLRAEAAKLRAERDHAVAEFLVQAERNRIENQKAIDAAVAEAKKAKDEQHNAMLQAQGEKLTWIGVSCISLSILAAVGVGFFGSIAGLRRIGPYVAGLAIIGFLFLGAAQIITQWWFMWACAAEILVIVGWFGIYAWRHQKRGDLAEELQARTAKVAAVAKTAVPVLDDAYDAATAETKAWLDTHIFDRLSDLMRSKPEIKQVVHQIRAET